MAPTKSERARLADRGQAQRKSEPGAPRGSYPTDTKGRAVAAKGRATQAVEDGRMSKATKASIDRRADKTLGKGKK